MTKMQISTFEAKNLADKKLGLLLHFQKNDVAFLALAAAGRGVGNNINNVGNNVGDVINGNTVGDVIDGNGGFSVRFL